MYSFSFLIIFIMILIYEYKGESTIKCSGLVMLMEVYLRTRQERDIFNI